MLWMLPALTKQSQRYDVRGSGDAVPAWRGGGARGELAVFCFFFVAGAGGTGRRLLEGKHGNTIASARKKGCCIPLIPIRHRQHPETALESR